MKGGEKLSLEQIQAFLQGSEEVRFESQKRQAMYDWITRLLREQGYRQCGKVARGLLRRYVAKVTGLSRAQVTRLIGQYLEHSQVKEASYHRNRFPGRFTAADIELLAAVDEAHETLSGPATKRILEREFGEFGNPAFERLASISTAHIYNLRRRPRYRQRRLNYTKTESVKAAIGERRRPDPQGQPGYLRVDTVHQGDLDGIKGVYHINAVDEVTQWQVVGAVEAITQSHVEPVLAAMLSQFPFPIRGFHSDNGSEFINESISGLLKRLLIEQTKSRPRHSNDNGLVESKNGAVIRKHMGYGYIAREHAQDIDAFYRRWFNPYLNFHRPCGQPERIVADSGKQKFVYRRYATPWEILRQLCQALPAGKSYLRAECNQAALERTAKAFSDTQAAHQMQQAKQKLFSGFQKQRKTA